MRASQAELELGIGQSTLKLVAQVDILRKTPYMLIQKTAQVFQRMAIWQLLAVLITALLCGFLAGFSATCSALLGGFAVMAGSFAGLMFSLKADGKHDASAILLIMLQAEVLKIVVIAVLLYLAFKVYTALTPPALIAGLAVAAVFSAGALVKSTKQSLS